MSNFSIGIIPGDGIGREVTPAAFEAAGRAASHVGATLEAAYYDWGSEYYFQHGGMMPHDALDLLSRHHAILLGAVGHPELPDHVTLNGLLLPIRRSRSICKHSPRDSLSGCKFAAKRA